MERNHHEDLDHPFRDRPAAPVPLPPDLAAFLKDHPFACLTHPTDHGTVFVLKAPRAELESVRGWLPISVRHELFDHPRAPVIRALLRLYDRPARPLAFEAFFNVRDAQQLEEYRDLARREHFRLLCYDEALEHRLTKFVRNRSGREMRHLLSFAVRLSLGIPADWYDFDLAKAAVQREVSL